MITVIYRWITAIPPLQNPDHANAIPINAVAADASLFKRHVLMGDATTQLFPVLSPYPGHHFLFIGAIVLASWRPSCQPAGTYHHEFNTQMGLPFFFPRL